MKWNAEDLGVFLTDDQVEMMISMGDRNNKGGVDHGDFLALMKELKIF